MATGFKPPQSPTEYLGLAAGLKTDLAKDNSMVQKVEESTLADGEPAHVFTVGMPDPNGQLQGYFLFKVRDKDSTIAEKEFVLLGRTMLVIRRVLTEPVEAPGVSWNLAEIEGTATTSEKVSVTRDMIVQNVSVQHMVDRAKFETYVFSVKPSWTGAIEITDCIDPASMGGRMFIMTARADDHRHLVLVQSPTYNMMMGQFVKAGQVVYTSPTASKSGAAGRRNGTPRSFCKAPRPASRTRRPRIASGTSWSRPQGRSPHWQSMGRSAMRNSTSWSIASCPRRNTSRPVRRRIRTRSNLRSHAPRHKWTRRYSREGETMSTERANNGRFLGALGFLGFLAFLAFTGTRHSELTRLAWVSVLSLVSLGVFIPFNKAHVKVAIDPQKKKYLGFLAFLGFLSFLGNSNPDLAINAVFAAAAAMAVQSFKPAARQFPAMMLIQRVNSCSAGLARS